MSRAHILVVDDDLAVAETIAEAVQQYGHDVTIARNGAEAIECSRRQDFDITFMDVDMPVMNGVDGFFQIRELKPAARVVMMTGFKQPIVDQALQNGLLGLILKPFAMSDLLVWIDGVTKLVA
jgi:CheY-like chemotaxis protein